MGGGEGEISGDAAQRVVGVVGEECKAVATEGKGGVHYIAKSWCLFIEGLGYGEESGRDGSKNETDGEHASVIAVWQGKKGVLLLFTFILFFSCPLFFSTTHTTNTTHIDMEEAPVLSDAFLFFLSQLCVCPSSFCHPSSPRYAVPFFSLGKKRHDTTIASTA